MTNMNPKGMGLYLRAISSKESVIKKRMSLIKRSKVKWVTIGTTWHKSKEQVWINTPEETKLIASRLSKEGIECHIWGYPWFSSVLQFVEDLKASVNQYIKGILIDPELGMRKHPKEASLLVSLLRKTFPNLCIGFTSYGALVKDFPWESFAEPGVFDPAIECDYGSPQLYESSFVHIVKGMNNYEKLGFEEIIPSIGLYKSIFDTNGEVSEYRAKTAAELGIHIAAFIKARPKLRSMIAWSENFLKPETADVLAQWSECLDKGILASDFVL